MNIEALRTLCLSLPHATEDIKWGADLCFSIGQKMFCITGVDGTFSVTLKVSDEDFATFIDDEKITPARYLARYKWINVKEAGRFTQEEWVNYVNKSYELIKSKLPKKLRENLS